MDAGSNVLLDHQGLYPKGSNPPFPAFSSCNNSNSGTGNNCLLRSASQQLVLDAPGGGVGGGAGFLGPCPPPYSCPPPLAVYSSLPPSHLLQQSQPPLLPIPLSKSSSLPSPSQTRRTVGAATARSVNKDSKKTKSHSAKAQKDSQFGGARPQKEPAAMTTPVNVPKPAASHFKGELPQEEGDPAGDVFSLSPPPSSLPMPRFSLRARASAEAFGGADTGASDDLRRLLRLH